MSTTSRTAIAARAQERVKNIVFMRLFRVFDVRFLVHSLWNGGWVVGVFSILSCLADVHFEHLVSQSLGEIWMRCRISILIASTSYRRSLRLQISGCGYASQKKVAIRMQKGLEFIKKDNSTYLESMFLWHLGYRGMCYSCQSSSHSDLLP